MRWRTSALVLVVAVALSACGSSSKSDSSSSPSTTASGSGGTLNVFAASSLTAAFTALGTQFEAAHPGTKVNFNFDSSTILSGQIEDTPGKADVFASADQKNMTKLQSAGVVSGTPTVFAKNQMEIAVEPGNPHAVNTVADLAQPNLIVVLCASEAPCGKYADQLLAQDKVTITPKSRELNASATLGKVESGDADAAIVYVTDVKGAGKDVDGVVIPASQNVVATLPIAALKNTKNATLAGEWIDFVTSSSSEKTLQQQYGFLAP
jgi:molybdate transport system substrate-binding protein